ncbi:MAG TPA: DUF3060 domain-containing protein [Pseudonocardiaceae bacterium]
MSRHVVLAAILAGLATTTLTACTVGGAPLGGTAPAATTNTAAGSAPATAGGAPAATGPAAGGAGGGIPGLPAGLPDLGSINVGGVSVGGSLPAGFPTPPGAGLSGAVGAEGNIAAQMQVADPTSAYDFWLSALPAAGYPVGQRGITTVNGVVHAGINFSGHGYQPSSAIAIVGTTATLGFEGGGSVGGGGAAAPPAAGGGGGGATITVEQPNVSQTLACTGGNTVYIQGPSDSITLTGSCGSVNVTGFRDTVVIDSAAAVNLTGVNDDVTVHTGNPQVSKTGENDNIHFG